jgi:hypothetical protein
LNSRIFGLSWGLCGLLACTDGTPSAELQVELSDVIPTVAAVTWGGDLEVVDSAVLVYGLDGEMTQRRVLSIDGTSTSLLGLKAGRGYRAQVVFEQDGESFESELVKFQTGMAPSSLPDIDVEVYADTSTDHGYILTPIFTSPAAPVIVDTDGDYVWWYIPDNSDEVNYSRVELSADGNSVLAWTLNVNGGPRDDDDMSGGGGNGTAVGGEQVLLEVSWDGTEVHTTNYPDGHHDMTVLADGTLAYLEYDYRFVNDTEIQGDRIVELAPDGSQTIVWSFWDDFESSGFTGGPAGTSWTHANALDYEAEEDAYYVSSLSFASILKIDRSTGSLEWVLGGDESDFTDSNIGTDLFSHQHQFQRVNSGILVFDNGDQQRYSSEAVEYRLDEASGTTEQVWRYEADPNVYSFSLGSVQRLNSGNTYVTFSNQGQIDEVSADGELLRRMEMSLGGATGYATWVETLYAQD